MSSFIKAYQMREKNICGLVTRLFQCHQLVKIMDIKNPHWSFGVLVGVSGAKYWRLLLDSVFLNIFLS